MSLRTAPLLLLLLLCGTRLRAQTCFTVAAADDLTPVSGCVAFDPQHRVLGVSDAAGSLCLPYPVDTVLLEAAGREPLRVALAEALRTGLVLVRRPAVELAAFEVEPWPTARDRHALATTTALDSATLRGFERASLRSALLWVPGVQMDQRGLGGSMRLSIRGSLLRSPFGVRGVKVYWGPFPLTLADGSTPLELLDPALADQLEVTRSVGSPVFGSAPAGLLLARPYLPAEEGRTVGAELIGGPNGYYRMAVQAGSATPRGALSTGLVKQGNDGFRQQEWSSRQQAWLVSRWRGKGSVTQAYITAQQASWALPGSVDSLTAYTDPRAARPYSAQVNAHVDKQQFFAGIHNEFALGKRLRMRSGLQGQFIDKVNPYGTTALSSGYKDESILGMGARMELAGERPTGAVKLAWQAGLEALLERDLLNERTYVDGQVGDVRTDARSKVGNLNGFAAVQARWERYLLAAALGSERTLVDHEDLLRDTTLSTSNAPVLFPSIGLDVAVVRDLRAHVRYATSVSRPTLWEQLGTAGLFNTGLKAERVSEVEAGITMGGDTAMFPFSAVVYGRTTEGLIVPETAANGVDQVYVNAGTARQNGVELTFGVNRRTRRGNWIRLDGNLCLQDHAVQLDDTGEERPVPGVPRSTLGARLSIRMPVGLSGELGYRYVHETPAALTSNALIPAYSLVHLRGSWTFRWSGCALTAFLHVDNLLDERYTAFVQVNDPGGRYFNPAPGRSLFVGCAFTWGAAERSY